LDTGVALCLTFGAAISRTHDFSPSPDDVALIHQAFTLILFIFIRVSRIASGNNLKFSLMRDVEMGSQFEIHASKNDELFFGFSVTLLCEFSNIQQKRADQMLVNSDNFIHTTIFVNGSHYALKNITQNLRCFKGFNLSFVQVKIRFNERILQIIVHVLLGDSILLLVVVDNIFV
jgi:hypothetical protein